MNKRGKVYSVNEWAKNNKTKNKYLYFSFRFEIDLLWIWPCILLLFFFVLHFGWDKQTNSFSHAILYFQRGVFVVFVFLFQNVLSSSTVSGFCSWNWKKKKEKKNRYIVHCLTSHCSFVHGMNISKERTKKKQKENRKLWLLISCIE